MCRFSILSSLVDHRHEVHVSPQPVSDGEARPVDYEATGVVGQAQVACYLARHATACSGDLVLDEGRTGDDQHNTSHSLGDYRRR